MSQIQAVKLSGVGGDSALCHMTSLNERQIDKILTGVTNMHIVVASVSETWSFLRA